LHHAAVKRGAPTAVIPREGCAAFCLPAGSLFCAAKHYFLSGFGVAPLFLPLSYVIATTTSMPPVY